MVVVVVVVMVVVVVRVVVIASRFNASITQVRRKLGWLYLKMGWTCGSPVSP